MTMPCDKEKKDELSGTGAVAPVTVPIGKTPNYGGKEKDRDDVEVWDDQEIKESILNNIKILRSNAKS